MMGRSSQDQEQLFYSFNLEEVVPDDHLVRAIARVLDLSWVRAELAPHYSHTRTPVDRSGADDPDAHRRLRVRHPLGTRAVPRGPAQPRLSLVLWPRHRGQYPRSFGVSAHATSASATAISSAACSSVSSGHASRPALSAVTPLRRSEPRPADANEHRSIAAASGTRTSIRSGRVARSGVLATSTRPEARSGSGWRSRWLGLQLRSLRATMCF